MRKCDYIRNLPKVRVTIRDKASVAAWLRTGGTYNVRPELGDYSGFVRLQGPKQGRASTPWRTFGRVVDGKLTEVLQTIPNDTIPSE